MKNLFPPKKLDKKTMQAIAEFNTHVQGQRYINPDFKRHLNMYIERYYAEAVQPEAKYDPLVDNECFNCDYFRQQIRQDLAESNCFVHVGKLSKYWVDYAKANKDKAEFVHGAYEFVGYVQSQYQRAE